MNHDEVEREMRLGMSLGKPSVVMHRSPRPKPTDETDTAILIHTVSPIALSFF
jgi:hypothetical protein